MALGWRVWRGRRRKEFRGVFVATQRKDRMKRKDFLILLNERRDNRMGTKGTEGVRERFILLGRAKERER